MRAQGRVWALLAVALTLLAVGQYQRHVELLQPSQAVKHQEELDEDHQILQSEEESEGIYKHWNAAHNDEIRGDNIGEIHPSSAWHHELFSKAKPVKKIRKHAKVMRISVCPTAPCFVMLGAKSLCAEGLLQRPAITCRLLRTHQTQQTM